MEEQNTTHFQLYLDEVGTVAECSKELEEQLYKSLLAGDTSVIGTISTQWLRRVIEIAKAYEEKVCPLDDLVQEGNMGLLTELHAIAVGSRVLEESNIHAHLTEAVRNAIEQYLGIESGETQQNETILGKVSLVYEAQKYLTEEQGSQPTLAELAEYTRIPEEELTDILSLIKEIKRD